MGTGVVPIEIVYTVGRMGGLMCCKINRDRELGDRKQLASTSQGEPGGSEAAKDERRGEKMVVDDKEPDVAPYELQHVCEQQEGNESPGEALGEVEPKPKERLVVEESYPCVQAVVSSHELLRHEREQWEGRQFSQWKGEKQRKERQDTLALQRECESKQLSEKETQQYIQQHQRRQAVEAGLRAYERYVRNSYGTVEITTTTPDGRRQSTEVRIPKTKDELAERVVKFSVGMQ